MVAAGIGVMVLFGFALAWLFALIGLSVTNGEAAQAAAFPLLAPLAFASNLFVDPSTMPGWLQPWAKHQPVSATADAVRACMLGGDTRDQSPHRDRVVARHRARARPDRRAPLPPLLTP